MYIPEETTCIGFKIALTHPPCSGRDLHFVQSLCGGGGGAVGGDVRPPLRVAHRNRETAKVGAHHANLALRTAGQAERIALAGVGRVHPVLTAHR